MADTLIRVGVIGTSWWADAMYLPALTAHPSARVIAVAGQDAERTKRFAERWNVPNEYTDWQALIARDDLDAVIIATPNRLHHPMTMAAIARGLHVLCEKPLALNYAEALQMTEAAEAAGIKTMVPFTYRFMPAMRFLKRLIDEGYIGRPYHLNMRYYAGYARRGEYHWRFDLGEAGAGIAGDLGAHWLYLARWLYGEIRSITCTLAAHVARQPRPDGQPYRQGDDDAVMVLEFENGALGVLHMTAVASEETDFGQRHQMEFHGSDGTLHLHIDWLNTQVVHGARAGEGPVRPLTIPDDIWGTARRDRVANTYKDVFRQHDFMTRGFITAIRDGGRPEPDFRDGLAVQRALEAALLSARDGRRAALAEIG